MNVPVNFWKREKKERRGVSYKERKGERLRMPMDYFFLSIQPYSATEKKEETGKVVSMCYNSVP